MRGCLMTNVPPDEPTMSRSGYSAMALTLFGAYAAWAQTPPAPPQTPARGAAEMATHDEPALFQARVNLVMVPVVVRDRQGKALGNLKQEDFQLFDKGKPQYIARFSMERAAGRLNKTGAPAPAPIPAGAGRGGATTGGAPPTARALAQGRPAARSRAAPRALLPGVMPAVLPAAPREDPLPATPASTVPATIATATAAATAG